MQERKESSLNLIPRPKSLVCTGEGCRLDSLTVLRLCCAGEGEEEQLRRRFPEAEFLREDGKEAFYLEFSRGGRLPPSDCPEQPDAYVLTVSEEGARIDARCEAGLFYGIQTLLQLPEDAPGLHITDYASIPIRMLHWDLKGYLPHFHTLLEELRILASYKVNALLLELEDKYDFRSAPGVGVAGAYTFEQLRDLSRFARSLHIRIVPKLQSIAHVDYILKHDAYRHLRENGHIFQFCAVNPQAQALWEAMCAELMECFAEHRPYFHIGADESGNLGECPDCRKLGAAGSYARKVGACIDFVRKKGWTPVMWDDIIRNANKTFSPQEEASVRDRLGRDAIIMYWSYGYGGQNNQFPYIEEFRSAGMEVWGASGYAGCDNWAGSLPPMVYRARNIDAWIKASVENRLECHCSTGWTRIGSADCPAEPQESSWFPMLYAAAGMWSGEGMDYLSFIRQLFSQLYGVEPEPELTDALMQTERSPYPFDLAENPPQDASRLQFLRYAAALESMARERTRLLNYLQYYDGKLGSRLEDYRLELLQKYSRTLCENMQRWRREIQEIYAVFYEKVTVDEILRTRFGYLERLLAELQRRLAATRPL